MARPRLLGVLALAWCLVAGGGAGLDGRRLDEASAWSDPFDFFDKVYVIAMNTTAGGAVGRARRLGLSRVEVVDAQGPPESEEDWAAVERGFTAGAISDLSSGKEVLFLLEPRLRAEMVRLTREGSR